MHNKKAAIAIMIAISGLTAKAQNRVLPIMELPASTEVLSLGGATTGNSTNAFIYSNPTALFTNLDNNFKKPEIDYSYGRIEKVADKSSYHTASIAYKLNERHALMFSMRYHDMGSISTFIDENMQEQDMDKEDIYAMAYDFGYTTRFSNHFSAFISIGYASENITSSNGKHSSYTLDKTIKARLGACYTDSISIADKPMKYNIIIQANNLGNYWYKDEERNENIHHPLSTRIGLGGNINTDLAPKHDIALTLDGGCYMKSGNSKQEKELAGGVTYRYIHKYAISFGGHIGDNNNFLTAGANVKARNATFGFATVLPLKRFMLQTSFAM
ncbi:MAG: PorV/PorQ family protein [Prevotella sp.]|nr:PorV/PorQ family protein [Prevotella sp.]